MNDLEFWKSLEITQELLEFLEHQIKSNTDMLCAGQCMDNPSEYARLVGHLDVLNALVEVYFKKE